MARVRHRRSVYRLGEREYRHRRLKLTLLAIAVLVAVGLYATLHLLKGDSSITPPPKAVVSKVVYKQDQTATFTEPTFSISLPSDWKPMPHPSGVPAPDYRWQGTTKDDQARWINVYVDRAVSKLALNRVVEVQASGSGLDVLGDVSNNCTTFTNGGSHAATQAAKWDGLAFLCDTGNYERDVVGIVSGDGANAVRLKGDTSGAHHFFITYTDNSPSPDYTVFTAALRTFQVK